MLKLWERSVAKAEQRMFLVAPAGVEIPSVFRNATADPTLREALVRQVQRMRGSVYLEDGAIRPHELTSDGRHSTPEDARSWHLLFLNAQNRISSAIWFLRHDPAIALDDLRIRHCALVKTPAWRGPTVAAVESELEHARQEGVRFAEVGGWAVAPEHRCTTDGLMLVLATFGLSNLLGGTLVLTMATARHCSSRILRRLGGSPLERDGAVIPPYFDPQYDCTMELLRFDTRRPSPKYSSLVQRLQEKLSDVQVIGSALAPPPALDSYEFPQLPMLQPAMAF